MVKSMKNKLWCSNCNGYYEINKKCKCMEGRKIKYKKSSIFANKKSEEEALKILNAIDPTTLNWQEADSIEQRMTYEVLDEKSWEIFV